MIWNLASILSLTRYWYIGREKNDIVSYVLSSSFWKDDLMFEAMKTRARVSFKKYDTITKH